MSNDDGFWLQANEGDEKRSFPKKAEELGQEENEEIIHRTLLTVRKYNAANSPVAQASNAIKITSGWTKTHNEMFPEDGWLERMGDPKHDASNFRVIVEKMWVLVNSREYNGLPWPYYDTTTSERWSEIETLASEQMAAYELTSSKYQADLAAMRKSRRNNQVTKRKRKNARITPVPDPPAPATAAPVTIDGPQVAIVKTALVEAIDVCQGISVQTNMMDVLNTIQALVPILVDLNDRFHGSATEEVDPGQVGGGGGGTDEATEEEPEETQEGELPDDPDYDSDATVLIVHQVGGESCDSST